MISGSKIELVVCVPPVTNALLLTLSRGIFAMIFSAMVFACGPVSARCWPLPPSTVGVADAAIASSWLITCRDLVSALSVELICRASVSAASTSAAWLAVNSRDSLRAFSAGEPPSERVGGATQMPGTPR